MSATLYVAISSHGYGHIAQTAPVVNELYRRMGDLRIVIECAAPRDVLASRFDMAFDHVPVASDFGMVMKNALEVDVAASHARYVDTHAHLDTAVEAARERMTEHRADVLLANVPYVPLIAAKELGLPAIAMCSLNWADIYRALCAGMPGVDLIAEEMLRGYGAAHAFLALEPGMEMPDLANVHKVGPVAATGKRVRSRIDAELGLSSRDRLVSVSMGGIATELDAARWPRVAGVTWMMPDSVAGRRDDMVAHSAVDLPFVDILSSSDAFVTKSGYGAFTEAACNGVPVLYVPRVDWPEAPFLVRWLQRCGRCSEISYDHLFGERMAEALNALWQLSVPERVQPTGVADAADIVERLVASRLRMHSVRASS